MSHNYIYNILFACCVIFHACHLLTFFEYNFFKKFFQEHYQPIRASNGLDSDQDRCSVGPDLDPNHLKRLSADGNSHPEDFLPFSRGPIKIATIFPNSQLGLFQKKNTWRGGRRHFFLYPTTHRIQFPPTPTTHVSDFIWPFLAPYRGTIPNQKMAYVFPILGIIFPKSLRIFPKCKERVV